MNAFEKANCAKCDRLALLIDMQKCGACNIEPLCPMCIVPSDHSCNGEDDIEN